MAFRWVERFNKIPGVMPRCNQGAAAAINTAVMATIRSADPLTRVDTGALKSNKEIVTASPGSLSGSVTWVQEYAIYQNSGTVYMSGTHFADQGAAAARPTFESEMRAVGFKLAG